MDEILKQEMQKELTTRILPYWMERMVDQENGGFYGRITGQEELMPRADKGAILNARILWTYSAAYRLLGREEYKEMANRAKRYLIDHFYDSEFGGVYWSLNYRGEPLDTKKQIYAIGFAIYGLSEFHRATGDPEALMYAVRLFNDIEFHSFDGLKNGYCEALTREWNEIADMRLSEKDANERKTMNTHLHILEPYTNLYRVWKDARLERQLYNLIGLFTEKILDKDTSHLQLFFDDDWQSKYPVVSYGHDIEASWLLHEAARVLGDAGLIAEIEPVVKKIAAAASEGLTSDGGMIYEKNLTTGHIDGDYHWWVQAETVVGYYNLFRYFGDRGALQHSIDCWEFIKRHLTDDVHGEWFWSLRADGSLNRDDDKAGFWKCPYHNGRMCIELLGE
ncbi:cellobiose 2-epimerase [Bacteroides fragilis]|uniref:cellobiose 2-epimerase n=1 Tax=Bacteroides fragilis TaxID=817 RepID=UPI0032F06335